MIKMIWSRWVIFNSSDSIISSTESSFKPCKEMHHILEQERARADRGGECFSLISFNIRDAECDHQVVIRKLAYELRRRIRKTDEIGWVEKDHLGVIMPQTSTEGARTLAEEVVGKISKSITKLNYDLYTYPTSGILENGKGDGDKNKQSVRAHTQSLSSRILRARGSHFKQKELSLTQWVIGRPPLWKRMIDILVSSLLLILFLPMFLAVGLFIKLISPGPVFFKQERVGRLGKPFRCWKLRTMKHNVSDSAHKEHLKSLIRKDQQLTKLDSTSDPRIIPFGNVLRDCGIDELPQLINVLRGDMSLVGPRPCLAYEANYYEQWQNGRFDVLPGLTGLWQVSGKNRVTFTEMMRLDLAYVRNHSVWVDFRIIISTVPAVLRELGLIRVVD